MNQFQWSMWQRQCIQVIYEHHYRQNNALMAAFVCQCLYEEQHSEREHWISPLFQLRQSLGFFHSVYPALTLLDGNFREYFRMSKVQLEQLLMLVRPKITKMNAIREAITAEERLCLTIRFLASGDSMTSMSYLFLMGKSTVSSIIPETCEAIWEMLVEVVMPRNHLSDDWLQIAKEFEQRWNFPHCIGAIDGKHVIMQCPDNAGSEFFNYKNSHSTILLGICDANYNFLYVDVGSYGRRSDGGVFYDSTFGKRFRNGEMNLPNPQPISIGGPPMPFVLVGDGAFPLSKYLMRPYPGRTGSNKEKKIFNYRLRRARKNIENTFGILANRWRILRRPIIADITVGEKIVLATCVLHNWLRKQGEDINQYMPLNLNSSDGAFIGSWRPDNDGDNDSYDDSDNDNSHNTSENNTFRNQNDNEHVVNPLDIRNEFCQYFAGEGAVPWQFKYC